MDDGKPSCKKHTNWSYAFRPHACLVHVDCLDEHCRKGEQKKASVKKEPGHQYGELHK